MGDVSLRDARAACQELTRHHAKSFYFASHVLPRQKRSDAYCVYAFCRHADDEVDLAPDEGARGRALVALSELLYRAYRDEPLAPDDALPWLPAFQETVARRSIPRNLFEDLLAGVALDRGRVRIASWEELDRYCYHVASVVGLIMVHVMAEPRPELLRPARDLGTAMQLTNILRDIKEDWGRDRLYLPAPELARFGLGEDDIAAGIVDERFRALVQFQIARARDYYRAAEPGIAGLPRDGSQLCARLMRTIYGAILDEIERADFQVYRGRVRVSLGRKLLLAAGELLR
jgi:phytoene synthase